MIKEPKTLKEVVRISCTPSIRRHLTRSPLHFRLRIKRLALKKTIVFGAWRARLRENEQSTKI